ncbi:MAG TPA: LuxR C-terminal-related transcriptional regulator [Propionibacteriaceae bacterium]|nr:LuxR C-terminal-related transcriptional regulator [Propionibacteriaceae bacterium]
MRQATLARTDAVAHSAAEELLGQLSRPQLATVPRRAGAEALSERELEVLRLLTSDLTGPEIAQHLFISLNTLRTHTKRIFTKLDVKTRRAAVTRATELGLL